MGIAYTPQVVEIRYCRRPDGTRYAQYRLRNSVIPNWLAMGEDVAAVAIATGCFHGYHVEKVER
jgi:hypothetical protein